ncbi:MAG: tyrosine--tRNA ligase [Candidatus Omnitrophica bacterium CG11_big_fil_rev_8_21_14_0_20_63_9]|nr:MAG: tyrosine--tRNA ligase [Candidatus Omnitrophica bacterium CG11_big_fil_rev_8_21_14_0_20_63_9]
MSSGNPLDAIRRGAVEIISEDALRAKLAQPRPLVIKAGFDPTAPDLHLGHTVLLRKLRQFQDLGHQVVFLIGDATALVGDPSGQSKMRKLMTHEEVAANAETYHLQVKKILDVAKPGTYQRRYNSEWFGGKKPFGLKELVELASRYSVARLIERDDFEKRLKGGQEVSMLELFYPLMQGYDSVMLKADVELGGTDQKFNLLVGRDLQRAYGQEPQVVITMPLLEGTDGVQKMSKSLNNHIGISEPPEQMFGKTMSIPDGLIVKYFTLLTDAPAARLAELEQQLKTRAINPRDAKAELAETLVAMYHGKEAAAQARTEFFKVFSKREAPTEMPEVRVAPGPDGTVDFVELLVGQGLAKTKNEARRLLRQGGVKLGGSVVKQPSLPAASCAGVLQVGPRHFRKLVSG